MDDTEQSGSQASDFSRPSPARWYYLDGEERLGPVDLAAMRRHVLDGTIGPDTLVWADGMPDWLPVSRVPALIPPPGLR